MASLPSDFAISLKARPSSKANATALPSLIERINFERGGFQNITEESLRQEIAEAELETENGEDNDSSSEDDEEPDRLKELMTAREEILGQVEYAPPVSQNGQVLMRYQLSSSVSIVCSGLHFAPPVEGYTCPGESVDIPGPPRLGCDGHAGCR